MKSKVLYVWGHLKTPFYQCLGACPKSQPDSRVLTFYLVHGIAMKWNCLLFMPAKARWAWKKLDWKQMRFNTKIEHKLAPWPFLKVKPTTSEVPDITLAKGINRKKKKMEGQSKCLWNKELFFWSPTGRFGVIWERKDHPAQLSPLEAMDTAAREVSSCSGTFSGTLRRDGTMNTCNCYRTVFVCEHLSPKGLKGFSRHSLTLPSTFW